MATRTKEAGTMFAPAQRRSAAGSVGSYVATNLYEGRTLFDVLGDEYVEQRRDDYPDLLSALACDEVVVRALACRRFI